MSSGIIATAIISSTWSSVIPRHFLNLQSTDHAEFDAFETEDIGLWKRITALCGYIARSCRNKNRSAPERQSLIRKEELTSRDRLRRTLVCVFVLLSATGLLYIGLSDFLLKPVYTDEELSPNARVYLQWCCDMVLFLPLVIMLLHHNRIFRQTHCVLIEGYSSFMNFLDGGDIVLLTGLFGVFAVSVMRLIAAVGIILRQYDTDMDDNLVLACFAVVYSLFDLCRAWVMTYFLFLVQRQNLVADPKTKWILITLVYTGVANATQWVLDSRDMDTWPVQSVFFAEGIGQSVGLLLDPVCMLYKLFASVVAYDALQNILSQSPTQSG